jgi:hypothetical protein
MKAKELAEQLLKYPDFDVTFDVCVNCCVHEYPWPEYATYTVNGIADIAHGNKVIVLDVDMD